MFEFRRTPISPSFKAVLGALGLALVGVVVLAPVAEARGFVSLGIGIPFPGYYYPPPVYYVPAYYPPAPAYYAQPPVVYAPSSPPTSASAPSYSTSNCREYQATQNIGGTAQQVVGTACLQPDGTWRIVK